VFKTWSNLNNFSNTNLLSSTISELIKKNKGFFYEFDSKRWVIDAIDKEPNTTNNLTIRTGRFIKYNFKRRGASVLIKPVSLDISIDGNKISLAKTKYEFGTYINSNVEFWVGTACGENPGKVYVKPVYGNTSEKNIYDIVLPMVPIQFMIKND